MYRADLRIFPPGLASLRKCCYILIFFALAHFIEVLAVLIIYCKEINTLWTKDWLDFTGSRCFSSALYSYSAAIGDSVVDSLIFALPIPYIWRLSKLRLRQRCGLMVVFGLGFVVCVVALLQIPFIRRHEGDTQYFGSAVNILVAIQISFAIIASSLPDPRALLARSLPNFSSLHHRSFVTGAGRTPSGSGRGRAEAYEAESGLLSPKMAEGQRAAFEGKKVIRKPDWLRSSIPASLMSTKITQSEMTGLSDEHLSHVEQSHQLPERVAR